MNDANLVCSAQRTCNRSSHANHELRLECPALAHYRTQRQTLEQLHDEVGLALVEHAKVRDRDDMRITDSGSSTCFLHEPLSQRLVTRELGSQSFERKLTAKNPVAHAIHRTHAAFAEELDHLVAFVDDASNERILRARRATSLTRAGDALPGVDHQFVTIKGTELRI